MTTLELQNTLMDKIKSIEDHEILNALIVLIDKSFTSEMEYELSEEDESLEELVSRIEEVTGTTRYIHKKSKEKIITGSAQRLKD